jgi:hypothetical protein
VPLSMSATPGQGAAFLISAYGVYEVIAANCSSPQTTELNADKRAETLMKWVHLGIAQSAILVTVAVVVFDRKLAVPIISGAVLAAGFMEASYLYAKKTGLEKGGTPTESW